MIGQEEEQKTFSDIFKRMQQSLWITVRLNVATAIIQGPSRTPFHSVVAVCRVQPVKDLTSGFSGRTLSTYRAAVNPC